MTELASTLSRRVPRLTLCSLLSLLGVAASWSGSQAADVQRIISLAPSTTETVFALGLGDRLVGVSAYCDHPREVEKIDRVGTFLTPNLEAIVAKRPEVILAVPSPGNQSGVESLRRLGFKVVVADPQSVAEIEEALVAIGRELGHEATGRGLVTRIRNHIGTVQARLADAPVRKVLMVVGHTPLIAVGSGTFQDELIRMARGINLAAAAGGTWPRLSLEFVIAAAPEVIIDTTMGNEERPGTGAAMAFWGQFSHLPAVRDRRLFGERAYQLLHPGPRVGDAFEAIARFIHPERFEESGH